MFSRRTLLWSACVLALVSTAGTDAPPDAAEECWRKACQSAPEGEGMVGVELLEPRLNTWPEFCVDSDGESMQGTQAATHNHGQCFSRCRLRPSARPPMI